jgi:hypothetical protein
VNPGFMARRGGGGAEIYRQILPVLQIRAMI